MRERPARLPQTLLPLALVCLCAATFTVRAHAQEEPPPPGTTRKIDEYGKIGHCDETARLDNFALELQNEPGARGYLVVYVGKNDLPSWTQGIKERAAGYLVNNRGLSADRVHVIDGGYRDERTTELWVVPENAPPPQPSNAIDYKPDRTKAYQWDEDSLNVEFVPDDTEPPAEDEAEDEEAADADSQQAEVEAVASDAEASGGEAGAQEEEWEKEARKYSIEVVAPGGIEDESEPAEADADKNGSQDVAPADEAPDGQPAAGHLKISLWWRVETLDEELKAAPDARLCLVYYWGLKNATQERVKEIVERAVAKTEEQLGVKRDRIILIDGGRSLDPGVELWVVPAGAQPPSPRPGQKRNFGFYTMPGEE